ncbi:MAG TPA: hypothetical protein VGM05_19345 [Planctomycetaceae bacterium]|jgi:hypothetical protein
MISLLGAAPAGAAPPTLTHVFPAGGQRGAKVVVTCTGKFDWPAQVVAPGVDAAAAAESGKLEIAIPADLAADRVWLRLYNAEGTSAAVPFLIGQLPELAEQEPNNTTGNAHSVAESNVTINGVLKKADVDGFAVRLDAGQTLVAALDAHTRLGSPMDAILQVAASDGIVLAENHDDLGLDPRLAFTPGKAGTFIVRLFAFPAAPDSTIAFHGGDNYIYRLTLTTGPFITHVMPLAAPLANPGEVEALGWNVPPGTKLSVVSFGGARLAGNQEYEVLDELRKSPDARLGFVFGQGMAGCARVRLTPYNVIPAVATPDANNPTVLPLASTVTGCLKAPRQTDAYRIPLLKGQHVVISVESSELELPLDPVLQLTDPKGAAVAEVDDTGKSRDAVLAHAAALDGDYRVTISDRSRQGGARCLYLLTARLDEPDFELSVSTDALVIPADKPAELAVKVRRHKSASGNVGPITIQAQELPPGVTAAPVVSEPTGGKSEEVKLTFTAVGQAFSGPLRIIGKASQPKELERSARTPEKLAVSHDSLWLTVIAKP